jgi:hypothetical protein
MKVRASTAKDRKTKVWPEPAKDIKQSDLLPDAHHRREGELSRRYKVKSERTFELSLFDNSIPNPARFGRRGGEELEPRGFIMRNRATEQSILRSVSRLH